MTSIVTGGQTSNSDVALATSSFVMDNAGSTPLTTKGDIFTYSTTDARLAVGSNGKVLTAASGETTGLSWATPTTGTVTATGSPADDEYAKWTAGTVVEGVTVATVRSDLGLGDAYAKDAGISDGDILTANDAVADNDFLKIDGTEVEGRTVAEVKSDLSLDNVENTALSTWAGTDNITTVKNTTFTDAGANVVLTGAGNIGLATSTATLMDLDTNTIGITGTIRSQAGTITEGTTNNIGFENGYWECPATATTGGDVTTTVVIPDGNFGGEKFTILCCAVGNHRGGVGDTTGKIILQGTWAGATPPTADITGATAAGLTGPVPNYQNVMFEFVWATYNGTPTQGAGWHYISRTQ